MRWATGSPIKPSAIADVEEIFYCEPHIKVRKQKKGTKKWIDLYFEASIHRDHPMICVPSLGADYNQDENKFWANMTDFKPGPELQAWLDQRPYTISFQGNRILIHLTKKDMALFKLFWG